EVEEFKTIMVEYKTSNLADIYNPLHVVDKERPSNCKFVSSIKKEQKYGDASIHEFYKYYTCVQLGHNFAFHKKNISHNQTHDKQRRN
ncbi:16199_t:CDS:1, partial [Dentiscutata erythropus]